MPLKRSKPTLAQCEATTSSGARCKAKPHKNGLCFFQQFGEFVAAAGAAQANRELVADQLAAAAGEDRWTAGEHARYYWLFLAEGHLTRRRFGAMLGRIALLRIPAG